MRSSSARFLMLCAAMLIATSASAAETPTAPIPYINTTGAVGLQQNVESSRQPNGAIVQYACREYRFTDGFLARCFIVHVVQPPSSHRKG